MAPQGHHTAKDGRFKGNESFFKHRMVGGGINCRKGFRSHASFLETKVLKADSFLMRCMGFYGLLLNSPLLPDLGLA